MLAGDLTQEFSSCNFGDERLRKRIGKYDVFAAAVGSKHANLKFIARAAQNRNTTGGEDWAEVVQRRK